MEVEDVDALVRPRRMLWPILGLALVGLVGAGVAFLFFPSEPPAWRALVFTSSADPIAADSEVQEALEGAVRTAVGDAFELPPPESRARDLAGGIDVARSQDALHVVALFVDVVEERPGVGLDRPFAHLSVRAEVGLTHGEGEVVSVGPVEVAGFGATPVEARREALRWGAPAIADLVHLALLERPAVRAFMDDPDPRTDLLERRGVLRDQLARVEHARGARERFDAHCEDGARALAEDASPHRRTCLSAGCAEEYAFGVTPDGRAALIHTETPHMSLSLGADGATPRRLETVEHIVLVPLDGSERRTLATTGNYYTYPTLSPDGRTIVAVEDWAGGFGLVAIDVASGERRLIAPFSGFPQAPALSPDGTQVLLFHRTRRRGDAELVVVRVDGGAPPRRVHRADRGEWVEARLAAEGASVLAIAERVDLEVVQPPPPVDPQEEAMEAAEAAGDPLDEEALFEEEEEEILPPGGLPRLYLDGRLALLDPASGEVLAWLDDDRHRLRSVLGSRDGEVVFTWDNNGVCGLAWWRPSAGSTPSSGASPLRELRTESCVDQARIAPDGSIVGVAYAARPEDLSTEDLEVVRVDPSTGALTPLTANALRERYPRVGAEGAAIVFDRVGVDRYRSFPRVAMCWLDAAPQQ